MKKIFLALFILLGSLTVKAQDLEWHTDISKAIKLSQDSKKPLLLFFTGSDWCGWCMKLQKDVLKTQDFAKWAKDNVVLVELDFPRRASQPLELKQQNYSLQNSFGVRAYPTVWLVDATGKGEDGKPLLKKMGKLGYEKGAAIWLEKANSILDFYSKKQEQ